MFFEVFLSLKDTLEQKPHHYLLDTDVLCFVAKTYRSDPDIVQKLFGGAPVYTTVLNVSEVFFNEKNDEVVQEVSDLLHAVNVLGIHQRYAKQIQELRDKCDTVRDAVFLSTALNNSLTVLTADTDRYRKLAYKKFNVKVV